MGVSVLVSAFDLLRCFFRRRRGAGRRRMRGKACADSYLWTVDGVS